MQINQTKLFELYFDLVYLIKTFFSVNIVLVMNINNLCIEYFIKTNGFIYFKNIKKNKIYKLNVCEDTNNIVLNVKL